MSTTIQGPRPGPTPQPDAVRTEHPHRKPVALRSLVLLAAGALPAAAAVLAVYGLHGALLTLALLAVFGAVALGLAHLVAERRRRAGPLRRQFTLAVAIAVGQLVALAAAFAALMFVSPHDALMVAVVACFAGAVAARAAQLFAGGVLSDVEAVRDGLRAIGQGERDVRVRTGACDELAELAFAANAMVDRIAAEEGARRDLVAAVSHDLRTPLTSLQLLAEAIEDGIVDEPTRRRYLVQMRTHIRALGALIDDLFELTRLEAGDVRWSVEQVRLDALVGETVDAMRAQAAAEGVTLAAVVDGRLAPARGNPERLQRVLFNLIQNAIRHTPADGSVTVRATRNGAGLEVEVADTGEGIAQAERERVFEPFYRGGSESARTRSGAGLGLAVSRAIVEAHGGNIWLAEGAPGTRVRFNLPAAT